jgi:hypothetical protein
MLHLETTNVRASPIDAYYEHFKNIGPFTVVCKMRDKPGQFCSFNIWLDDAGPDNKNYLRAVAKKELPYAGGVIMCARDALANGNCEFGCNGRRWVISNVTAIAPGVRYDNRKD